MALLDGETFFGTDTATGTERWVGPRIDSLAGIPAMRAPVANPRHHRVPTEMSGVQAYAFVNHGRWIVRCPFCPSAQIAFRTDKRFLCAGPDGCANYACGHQWVEVVWPSKAMVKRIEDALADRPLLNQNWEPPETVATLLAENEAHGVG